MPWDPEGTSYWIAGFAFQRLIGVAYLIAFLVARNQFPALLGSRGLEPVPRFVRAAPFRRFPSLFHFHYSDRFFRLVAWAGIVLSAGAATGLTDLGPIWLSIAVWLVIWLLYLSIVNVGQTFYGFGWESKLLDAGFIAIFLGPAWMSKPWIAILLLNWLLFRVELGAGLIKMRGDPCWRKLTCMLYHHETQPLPNPLSWYFHQSPAWMHKCETLGNHIVQLGVVWLIFAPQPIAAIAGGLVILSQLWLLQSGNYSWLNFMTIAIALSTLHDGAFAALLGVTAPDVAAAPLWFEGLGYAFAAVTAALSVPVVNNLLSRAQLMNYSFNPLHLVNTYGAFGGVTKERHEAVIEGTSDPDPAAATWQPYRCKAKPGDPTRRPPQIAPYHLRLDWQLWFVPLMPHRRPEWLIRLIGKLLEGDRATLALFKENPFPDRPPRFVRVAFYRYRYTTPAERRATGRFWDVAYLGEHIPPVGRDELAGMAA